MKINNQEISQNVKIESVVMFTDVIDSTVIFETLGDDKAHQLVANHYDLLFPIVTKNNGRVIKTIGDSIMAVFNSPSDGILAASEMQQTLFDCNANKSLDEVIKIRIGLHWGEVIVYEKDVFGDVVITAKRIESKASAYNIFISEDLKNKLDKDLFEFCYIGDYFAKGKLEPIVVFGVLWSSSKRWLKDIYKQRKKELDKEQNTKRIQENRKSGKIGKSGHIRIFKAVTIITNPPGAQVWMDNVKIDKITPFSKEFKTGQISIRIEKVGYKTIEDHIDVFENLSNDFLIELQSIKGSITVITPKSGFRILFQDKQLLMRNNTFKFKDLIPGKYEISLSNDEYYSCPKVVELSPNQEIKFKPDLIKFSKFVILSKYKNIDFKIIEISSLKKYVQPIFYKPSTSYVKGISNEMLLHQGEYKIIPDQYFLPERNIEIQAGEFRILDYDSELTTSTLEIKTGKYNVEMRFSYLNRMDSNKAIISGNNKYEILPDKIVLELKHKWLQKKISFDSTKGALLIDFEKEIKNSFLKKITKKFFIMSSVISLVFIFTMFCYQHILNTSQQVTENPSLEKYQIYLNNPLNFFERKKVISDIKKYENVLWKKINKHTEIKDLRLYKKFMKEGKNIKKAEDMLDELSWLDAIDKNSFMSYSNYLIKCRNGKYKEQAITKIRNIFSKKKD